MWPESILANKRMANTQVLIIKLTTSNGKRSGRARRNKSFQKPHNPVVFEAAKYDKRPRTQRQRGSYGNIGCGGFHLGDHSH